MDDYEKYLKHASQVKRKTFSHGFVDASRDFATMPTEKREETIVRMDVGSPVNTNNSNMLPLKKKKRTRSPSSDDEAQTTVKVSSKKNEQPSAPAPAPAPAEKPKLEVVVRPPPPQGKKTISLLQKWFPGNALKEATVEASQAPTADYVEVTIKRFSTARERMISLRSDVEDTERLLIEHAGSGPEALADRQQRDALVDHSNWKEVRDALTQCAERAPTTLKETKKMVGELLRRKDHHHVPLVCSVKRWHEFLNQYGPAADKFPSLSHLVWLSSAATTCGFTVLVKRFISGVKDALLVAQGSASSLDSRGKLYIADEEEEHNVDGDDDEEDNVNHATAAARLHGNQEDADSLDALITKQPELKHIGVEAHRKLLVFLRLFMPSESTSDSDQKVHRFSGFGVWLLSMLTALDAPLDPDTDRLVHDLFRRTCEQVRVIGDYKQIHGEHRGDLVSALSAATTSSASYKPYTKMEDVGKADVLALYSLLIVLSNFFRQNQNRLIPL